MLTTVSISFPHIYKCSYFPSKAMRVTACITIPTMISVLVQSLYITLTDHLPTSAVCGACMALPSHMIQNVMVIKSEGLCVAMLLRNLKFKKALYMQSKHILIQWRSRKWYDTQVFIFTD